MNTITNNLPFELQASGYNFIGPKTKLNKRLSRGNIGINPFGIAYWNNIPYTKQVTPIIRKQGDPLLKNI